MRLLYTIVLLFLTSLVYGQKSELLQNVNARAKELTHYLNTAEDSIIFKCDRTIYEVMIFNNDFERIIKVKDTEAKILIGDIPVGRYAVEAVLKDKLIIITLLRNETFDLLEPNPLITDNASLLEKALASPKDVNLDTEITSLPKNDSFGSENNTLQTDLGLSGKEASPFLKKVKEKTIAQKKQPLNRSLALLKNKGVDAAKTSQPKAALVNSKANSVTSKYWVLYKINNGSSSEKVLKMADQKTVDRLIHKIEIDMKTSTGRLNELTVWQIYNTDNFVLHKRKNKAHYMNTESDSFNMVPYFKKENN